MLSIHEQVAGKPSAIPKTEKSSIGEPSKLANFKEGTKRSRGRQAKSDGNSPDLQQSDEEAPADGDPSDETTPLAANAMHHVDSDTTLPDEGDGAVGSLSEDRILPPGDHQQALTWEEKEDLSRLEARIQAGRQTFIEVGEALADIQEKRLYRASAATFQEYCQSRWWFTRNRAYHLIAAAEVAGSLLTEVSIPVQNERQARELVSVPAEQRKKVWETATERNPQPTAAAVREAKEEVVQEDSAKGATVRPSKKKTPFRLDDKLLEFESNIGRIEKRCPAHRWREFCTGLRLMVFRRTWQIDRKPLPEAEGDETLTHADLDGFIADKIKNYKPEDKTALAEKLRMIADTLTVSE